LAFTGPPVTSHEKKPLPTPSLSFKTPMHKNLKSHAAAHLVTDTPVSCICSRSIVTPLAVLRNPPSAGWPSAICHSAASHWSHIFTFPVLSLPRLLTCLLRFQGKDRRYQRRVKLTVFCCAVPFSPLYPPRPLLLFGSPPSLLLSLKNNPCKQMPRPFSPTFDAGPWRPLPPLLNIFLFCLVRFSLFFFTVLLK